MFDTFGRGLSSKVFDHALQQAWDMDSDFFYEDNAPVQEYTGLMMDLYGATDELAREQVELHRKEGHSILHLMDEVDIADKILDAEYLERIRDQDEDMGGGGELVRCVEAVRTLTKKQMLEAIPATCMFVQRFLRTRGTFECLEELFAEVETQNERLEQQLASQPEEKENQQ